MKDFTFLTEEQIFGNDRLDIFKKYGTLCAITDFSNLLGGQSLTSYYNNESILGKDRIGWWWTKTPHDGDACYVGGLDCSGYTNIRYRDGGARPVLPYSSIFSETSGARLRNGIIEVGYGEYPQMIVPEDFAVNLEFAYREGRIKKTGKSYTTDSDHYNDWKPFEARTHIEYEFNGKKYIRFVAGFNCNGKVLSDGSKIQSGVPYWIKVEPIVWMIDEKNDIALSEKIVFSGVQFNRESNYQGDFENTDIKKFMDTYFAKEILTDKVYNNTENEKIINKTRKQNPYGFDFQSVSEEDIIKGAIESDVAVFLHGRSSEGKSARVKQLDPDCEIIYLRNATPESLNGKSVYNQETGEMIDIPPTWYKKLKIKCEEEPDKIHIVFFDEITNALPSIQGMAFNIVLDKEVNGIWKLPENARIVAAGNDLKDSLAANTMAEPLFNRFAHVYINTTVESWLKWASKKDEEYEKLDYKKEEKRSKIHPAIYAYIAYRGESVLRTEYNGETPNADPRKWEMASHVLYKSKNPEMLRALVGEKITKEFVAFCKQQVITLEDVLSGNYSEDDLRMNLAEAYATAVSLTYVDETNFKIVREFMKKVGNEPKATFETLWARGDERRLGIIAELEMSELLEGGIKR